MDRKSGIFVDVDGIRTRYFEAGSGETVLLVHGGNFGSPHCCDCSLDWNLNFDGLAEHFHVVALDKLGQGFTGIPNSQDDYTMDAVVRHTHRFMETLDLGDVHVVGHSRGGYLTCRLTLEFPGRVKSCTVIDSNTGAPGQGRNHIEFADTPKPYLSRASQRWVLEGYSHNPKIVTEEWLDEMEEIAAQPTYRAAVEMMEQGGLNERLFQPSIARGRAEMFDWLMDRGMERPTLVVWGLNDPTATLDQGFAYFEFLAHKEARTEMHIFNKSGHFTYREHPAAFNETLRSFVMSC